jgi:hypothetical protein
MFRDIFTYTKNLMGRIEEVDWWSFGGAAI